MGRFPSPCIGVIDNVHLFMLEGNISLIIFFSSYNVVISNALSFMIEWNLARVRFLLLDNVVVGNRLEFLLKVNIAHARYFFPYNVCYVLVFVLQGNLARIGIQLENFLLTMCLGLS